MMENPLSGAELFVGTITGLLGMGTAEVVDRLLASHALAAQSDGTFHDGQDAWTADAITDPTLQHYNATLILAPMNWKRWLAGAGIAGVPLIVASFIKAPAGRSALQLFGFGAALRTLGKGVTDMAAYLTRKNAFSQRVFHPELAAQASTNTAFDTAVPGVNAAGGGPVGLGHQLGMGHACCSSCAAGGPCGCPKGITPAPPGQAWANLPPQQAAPPPPPPPAPAPPMVPTAQPPAPAPAPIPIPTPPAPPLVPLTPPVAMVPPGGGGGGGGGGNPPAVPAPGSPSSSLLPFVALPAGGTSSANLRGVGAPNGSNKGNSLFGPQVFNQ